MTQLQKHTLQAVTKASGAAELKLPAATQLFIVAFPANAQTVTPEPEDEVPGLYGDFAPDAEDSGETTALANTESVYVPGAVTFAEKTLTMKATGAHPKVVELWAHAGVNKGSAKAGLPMAYNCMNADRSGWAGQVQVKTMNIPTDGSFEHRFSIQYLTRIYVEIADNPEPVETP